MCPVSKVDKRVSGFVDLDKRNPSEIEAFQKAAEIMCELLDHKNNKTWRTLYFLHVQPKASESQLLSEEGISLDDCTLINLMEAKLSMDTSSSHP